MYLRCGAVLVLSRLLGNGGDFMDIEYTYYGQWVIYLFKVVKDSLLIFESSEFTAFVIVPLTFYAVIRLFWSLACVND